MQHSLSLELQLTEVLLLLLSTHDMIAACSWQMAKREKILKLLDDKGQNKKESTVKNITDYHVLSETRV